MNEVVHHPHGFHAIDYAIFGLVLLISLAIGLYHACSGGKQRTTKEFLMADRRMNTFPVALSILVSFISGILVLGTPAEMYTRGTQLFMRTFGYCIACVLSSVFFVPLFFNLKVTSSFEVYKLRVFV
jgi:Na+/proline symporter